MALSSAPLSAQSRWVVDQTPLLDIRDLSASNTVQFQFAVGGTRLSNGSILVSDQRAGLVRLFDRDGKAVRTVGGFGKGPGKFTGGLMPAARCGQDTLVVYDKTGFRATIVGPTGVIIRQISFARDSTKSPAFNEKGTPFYDVKCAQSGAFVFFSIARVDKTPPNRLSFYMNLNIRDRNGESQATHAVPFAFAEALQVKGVFPIPMTRSTYLDPVGPFVAVGTSDTAVVGLYNPSSVGNAGSTVAFPVRWLKIPRQPRAPTRAEFLSAIDDEVSKSDHLQSAEAGRAALTLESTPKALPAFSGLFGDEDGKLWVQVSPQGAKTMQFVVLNLDGLVIAHVTIPMGLKVFEIGHDYVLGSYQAKDDAAHVVVLKLRRE